MSFVLISDNFKIVSTHMRIMRHTLTYINFVDDIIMKCIPTYNTEKVNCKIVIEKEPCDFYNVLLLKIIETL